MKDRKPGVETGKAKIGRKRRRKRTNKEAEAKVC